ncbi:MAG: hypothetical protein OXK73_08945 [Rhodospirillaceae bacterium]|nr:hypothetical protein [Rhodospirillaceae bacterium]
MHLDAQALGHLRRGVCAPACASLEVHAAECHSRLGDNGTDRSTFIKAMSRVHEPTGGLMLMGGGELSFEGPRNAMMAGGQELAEPEGSFGSKV